jgi:DNA-binding PadR family transcriptional regulator
MFGFHRHPHKRHTHGAKRFARDEIWGEGGRGRHGRGGGHFHHRRPGHRGRVFDQGDLRLVILGLLAEAPRHGYEIIKLIEDKLGGAYSPSPGVVYPTLTHLEELGYASLAASEGGKKLYAVTGEGTAFLEQNRTTVDELTQRMARIGEAEHGPTPQVMRAVENLRSALRHRVASGPLTDEQSRAIADALDAATRKIEEA